MAMNVDAFNKQVAVLLADLYRYFPVRVDCQYSDLLMEVRNASQEEFEIFQPDKLFARSTMERLVDEGFVDADDFDTGAMRGAVLTLKGLTMLNAVPDALQQKATLGEKLQEAVADAAMDKAKDLVKTALGASIAVAIKSISG